MVLMNMMIGELIQELVRYPNWDKYDGFHPSFIENKGQTKKTYYHDNKYNYVSIIEIDEKTKKIKKVSLSVERVNYEQDINW